jgi:hypothetical protein
VISDTPPPQKKVGVFRGKKNESSPLKTAVSDPKFWPFLDFGQNFVTPFSTLANLKGSLPTNSTTPDRLRVCDSGRGRQMMIFLFFFVSTSPKKKVIFRARYRVLIYKPIAGFS